MLEAHVPASGGTVRVLAHEQGGQPPAQNRLHPRPMTRQINFVSCLKHIIMKSLCKLLALAFVAATFQFCSDENNEAITKADVSFNAELNASLDASVSSNPIQNISLAHVTLENPHGKVVVQQELQFALVSNMILTTPVELAPGEYRIREFSLRDADKNVLYNLIINLPTSCEGDKNLLQTFYAGGASKSISLTLHSVPLVKSNN